MSHIVEQGNSAYEAQSRKKPVILHPILTSIFPILAFYTANIDQVGSKVIWRPLVVSIAMALILWGLLWLILKNSLKSGLLTTWLLIMFFTYGHLRNLVLDVIPTMGQHRFMFPLWIVITLMGGWLILKKLGNNLVLNTFLNVFSIAMILIPIFRVGQSRMVSEQVVKRQIEEAIPLTMPENPPDIYYIILDGYARADVLQEIYNFDNTPFLDQLREMGFYVADCSLANYASTEFSLASSLNMSYYERTDRLIQQLPGLIKNNKVWSSLRSIGYTTIAFETEWDFINIVNSDIYFQSPTSPHVNGFEFMFLRTTEGVLIWDALYSDTTGNLLKYLYFPKAERDLFILDKLKIMAELPGPKVIYAHITITHTPYLFDQKGLFRESNYYSNHGFAIDEQWDKLAYASQVEYVNRAIYETLQKIISESQTKPIVILQGDHGANPPNAYDLLPDYMHMPILNAYLVPQPYMTELYPDITPVNSFRLVFDAVFNGKLGLFEDRSTYYNGMEYLESWEICR